MYIFKSGHLLYLFCILYNETKDNTRHYSWQHLTVVTAPWR